jgi:cellulose synthase/poly-beta-1,6-N-acetylglucosamine synthase-like glycosyltransferase
MIGLFLLTLCLAYGFWVLRQRYSWQTLPKVLARPGSMEEEITILVVARNECQGLSVLIQDLERQDFPLGKINLVVLNDASTDGTQALLETYNGPLKLQWLTEDFVGVSPKRNALKAGMAITKTDLVLCTDADCLVGTSWVSGMVAASQQADFVSAPVIMEGNGVWAKMQQLEFASLVGSGMTLLRSGFPLMCNGANMAFRRSAFLKYGGFEGFPEVASGDDVFMMQRFYQANPNRVIAVADESVCVETSACPDWTSFYKQRLRWAGKWSRSLYRQPIPVAALVFLVNLVYLISPFLLMGEFIGLSTLIAIWTIRVVSEALFLSSILRKLGKSFKFDIFLLVFFLYAPYVVMFGILAALGVKTTWKNRVA